MAVAAVVGAVVTIGGCNPRDAGNLAQDARNLSRDTGQAVGSATLAGKVNAALSLRKGINMSGLHVDAQDGVVTVGGHVRTVDERRRVVRTIDETRGVTKVIDHLRVEPTM